MVCDMDAVLPVGQTYMYHVRHAADCHEALYEGESERTLRGSHGETPGKEKPF